MTEQEAKTKWCPYARVTTQTGRQLSQVGNRVTHLSEETRSVLETGAPSGSFCIASACMAWRWIRSGIGSPAGYCGLAGRPE